MNTQKPSVCRLVHYVCHGTPGGEYESVCRAATVTEVDADDSNRVGLAVLNPTGLFFHSLADGGCAYDDGSDGFHRVGGTWHWPERE